MTKKFFNVEEVGSAGEEIMEEEEVERANGEAEDEDGKGCPHPCTPFFPSVEEVDSAGEEIMEEEEVERANGEDDDDDQDDDGILDEGRSKVLCFI